MNKIRYGIITTVVLVIAVVGAVVIFSGSTESTIKNNTTSDEFRDKMTDLSKTITDLDTVNKLSSAIKLPSIVNRLNAVFSVGANVLSKSKTDMNTCLTKSIELSSLDLSSVLELMTVGAPVALVEISSNHKFVYFVNELTKDIRSEESLKAQDSFNESAKLGMDMVYGTKDRESILHDWLACSRAFKKPTEQP